MAVPTIPWDLSRTSGGSSGGEAAAIAAGCSAGGVGSDGGGSIRIPAHYTGICGLKPTPGRVPATGHYPASAGPFAQLGVVGPMARTIADVARLFEVMAGPDIGDPASAPVPLRRWSDEEIRKLRIAYFEDDGETPVTPETAAAVRKAAEASARAGISSGSVAAAKSESSVAAMVEFIWPRGADGVRSHGRRARRRAKPDAARLARECGEGSAARWARLAEHADWPRRACAKSCSGRWSGFRFCFVPCAPSRRFVTASASGRCRARKWNT